ncbi:MAG TPA: MFS transporter [Steroidobacteraceae bacterium]|nr:MFS transporter [Steroidobacteraceae bacterium]
MTAVLPSRTAVSTILLCALGAVFEGVDVQVAGVAAAGIIAEFRPDPQRLGTFFSASTLGLCAGALLGGRLSDRIGRKRVLVMSVAVFGVFSLLAATASTMSALTWARLLTGLGLGGAFPIFVALTAESSAPNRRSSNVALVYSAMPFGGAVVSLLSMLIAPDHWRQLFIVGGICPLVVAPIMAIYMQESRAFQQTVTSTSALTLSETGFLAVMAHGRALQTILLWTAFFLGLLTLYLLLNWLPTLLLGYGLSKHQASFAQIAFNLGGSVAALSVGRLLDSSYRRRSVVVVFAALPVSIACLALAPKQSSVIVLIVLALGIVVLASQGVMHAIAPACYPTRIRGVGVGTAIAVGRLGSIVGPALAGVFVARGQTTSQLLLHLVPITLIDGICAISLVWIVASRGASDS